MKNNFLFSLLLAIVHLANAQDTIEPNAAKNQRFFFGFRPGFNVLGIGNELETAMRQDGRLNGEGFFSQDYPRARISAGFLSAFEYKKDPLALGIEIGSVAVGKTRGLIDRDLALFLFPVFKYLDLKYRVYSISPFARVYVSKMSVQMGVTWNRWTISSDSITGNLRQSGSRWGASVGLYIPILENSKSRIQFSAQYRTLGHAKVGPYAFIDDFGTLTTVMERRKVRLRHVFIGVSIDFDVSPKRWRGE